MAVRLNTYKSKLLPKTLWIYQKQGKISTIPNCCTQKCCKSTKPRTLLCFIAVHLKKPNFLTHFPKYVLQTSLKILFKLWPRKSVRVLLRLILCLMIKVRLLSCFTQFWPLSLKKHVKLLKWIFWWKTRWPIAYRALNAFTFYIYSYA